MEKRWKDKVLDNLPEGPVVARVYEGADCRAAPPIVLYLHGGAFADIKGDGEHPVARALADAGSIVVAPDYRKASEPAFPNALERAFSVLRYLNGKRKLFGAARSPLFVAGEEAGGNVAAAAALKARDAIPGDLDGQILLSPLLDPSMGTASFRDAEQIGMRQRWSEGWNTYLGFGGGVCHPYAAPCYCSRLAGLAPALVMTAADDPLRDEAVGYCSRLEKAGVFVRRHVLPIGTGWPLMYGGCCDGDTRWLEEIRDQFALFLQTLKARTV
ncbi:alpha/beta hydrolase [Rhizobiaceae bacterium n13]|uniref:Alpha/beta hydrolase n=1 Tax=Ferirhizobium litorale TaxID=2927786 RepID=A0AAE3QBA6_9HYPH|nr:alpha/beta hydrolase [Fererhizobium litorale]MDI7862086.1 alpha/beta hydrolase [Fererhizobium litorale]MDI7922642.1 alpha/beta hydrolase [Fererhizobium litorale]